jgi:hypothetical protein
VPAAAAAAAAAEQSRLAAAGEEKAETSKEEGEGGQAVLKTWAVSIKSTDKVNELIEVVKQHKGVAPAEGEAQV